MAQRAVGGDGRCSHDMNDDQTDAALRCMYRIFAVAIGYNEPTATS
jgi:hypothetical protein